MGDCSDHLNGIQRSSHPGKWGTLLSDTYMTQVNSLLPKRRCWVLGAAVVILAACCIASLALWYVGYPDVAVNDQNATTMATVTAPRSSLLETLLEAQSEEPPLGAMRRCLDKAVQEFPKEPSVVQNNARVVVRCNGTRREFLSGQGENYIKVLSVSGKEYYTVEEANPEVRLARLVRYPLPLNLTSLSMVLQEAVLAKGTETLQTCLQRVLDEFPWEPRAIQDDAKVVMTCGGKTLTFISGNGKTEISVYTEDVQGTVQYKVKASGSAWWARFFKRSKIE